MTATTPRRSGRPSAIAALGMTGAPTTPTTITDPPTTPNTPTDTVDDVPTPVRHDVHASRRTDVPTSRTPAGAATPATVAYTLRLTAAESLAADELTLAARRTTGRRVDRSGLIRALLALATDDPTILARALTTATTHRH
jgi:hypothetical protein